MHSLLTSPCPSLSMKGCCKRSLTQCLTQSIPLSTDAACSGGYPGIFRATYSKVSFKQNRRTSCSLCPLTWKLKTALWDLRAASQCGYSGTFRLIEASMHTSLHKSDTLTVGPSGSCLGSGLSQLLRLFALVHSSTFHPLYPLPPCSLYSSQVPDPQQFGNGSICSP